MTKTSIRKELNNYKKDVESLKKNGKLSPEFLTLITGMLQLMSIMMTLLSEKKTPKNSSNSGLPPSQNFGSNGNRNERNDKKEDQRTFERLDNVTDTESHETLSPTRCCDCGSDLSEVKVIDTEDRKEIDILYEVHEHTVTSEVKKCPDCGQENIAEFPKGIDGPIQYGIGIKAAIINFIMVQMISLQRTGEHFKGLLGRFISPAVILKYMSKFSDSLEFWEAEIVHQLLTSTVIHVDETSMRVNKKNYWIHTYSCGDFVLQFLHPSRGRDAIEDIGILDRYGGVIVHDCWSPYFTYEKLTHALCLAHLLRELKFIEDSTGISGQQT